MRRWVQIFDWSCTSLHLLNHCIPNKCQSLSSRSSYNSPISSPAAPWTLEKDNYLVLCSKVLLLRLWDVNSDWKIILLTCMTSLTTLKWHACQSTASKYSHSIADLCRQITHYATRKSNNVSVEFIAAFHHLRSSLLSLRHSVLFLQAAPWICQSLRPSSGVTALSSYHYQQDCHFQLPRRFEPLLQLVAQVPVEVSW